MTKPFSVARDDFEVGLRNLVLEGGLPASVTADILRKMLLTVERAAEKQLATERQAYEKALAEEAQAVEETATGADEE